MKTFNRKLKQHWIDVMQAHQDADRLIQGEWFDNEDGTGCFFGCAMQTGHDALEKAIDEMQLPAWLVYLAEKIFETLPKADALVFPVQLIKAVPTSADISEVKYAIAVKRLEPLIEDSNGDNVNSAIQQVIDYHKNSDRTEEDRQAAYSAADSATRSAAVFSAARLAAYSAAYSAADLAPRSAAACSANYSAAAYSANYSAGYSAARSVAAHGEAWQRERDNLINALKEL
jgi:hypothetical protein